eukprot:scaffold7168_cov102-Isochrysis_galbana.AAC.2
MTVRLRYGKRVPPPSSTSLKYRKKVKTRGPHNAWRVGGRGHGQHTIPWQGREGEGKGDIIPGAGASHRGAVVLARVVLEQLHVFGVVLRQVDDAHDALDDALVHRVVVAASVLTPDGRAERYGGARRGVAGCSSQRAGTGA